MKETGVFEGKRLLSEADGMKYVGLQRTKFRQWAAEIGAVRHIGARVLYDRVTIDQACDALADAACNQG